jgi:hypothetical protein
MKIYISLPISGLNVSRCRNRALRCKLYIERLGHEAITPFDVCPDSNRSYAYFMGRDIEALMNCDAIFLMSGWSESRGCQLEWRCAEIYRKKIFHHFNELEAIAPRRDVVVPPDPNREFRPF